MRAKRKPKGAALVGLGFDGQDGTTRLTRGKNFVLAGGSEETHGVMQETAIKINEHLDSRGKRLEDISLGELRDICEKVAALGRQVAALSISDCGLPTAGCRARLRSRRRSPR